MTRFPRLPRLARLQRLRAELLTALALLGGWLLVTWGVAALTHWAAWPISLGILSVSLGGWRFAWTVARDGLYTLTRDPSDG